MRTSRILEVQKLEVQKLEYPKNLFEERRGKGKVYTIRYTKQRKWRKATQVEKSNASGEKQRKWRKETQGEKGNVGGDKNGHIWRKLTTKKDFF